MKAYHIFLRMIVQIANGNIAFLRQSGHQSLLIKARMAEVRAWVHGGQRQERGRDVDVGEGAALMPRSFVPDSHHLISCRT